MLSTFGRKKDGTSSRKKNGTSSQKKDGLSSRKQKSSPTNSGKSRKKQKKSVAAMMFDTDDKILESMNEKYRGKRILLQAKDIYTGRIPRGEEHFLFQYRITEINEDCESAEIDYEDKCIVDGGSQFQSYPEASGDDCVIDDYKIILFNDDHERFNAHVGRGNKLTNDRKETQRKKEEEERIMSSDDVSDLDRRFYDDGVTGYKLLLSEFESVEGLKEHVIGRGKNMGKTNYKQEWSKSAILYFHKFHRAYHCDQQLALVIYLQNTNTVTTVGNGTANLERNKSL